MFVFTFTFAMSALIRIESVVPVLSTVIAAYSSAVCLGLFLYLIDRVSRNLRPSGALHSVASQAHQVIESVYPRRLGEPGPKASEATAGWSKAPTAVVTSPRVGTVLAFDLHGLVALAARHDCVIELIPQVGSFVAP